MAAGPEATYAEPVRWKAARPRFRPLRLVLALLVGAVAVVVSGLILPGVEVKTFLGALEAAALIAVLNAILPPLVAALRLPLMLVIGFFAVLIVDALILLLVSHLAPGDFKVNSFGWALLAALVMSAASMVLQVFLGVDDDDVYSLRVIERVARRQGGSGAHRRPGDHLPRDRRARGPGASPRDARRQHAGAGPVARRRQPRPDRVGARPVLADGSQPGRASCSAQTTTSRRSAGSRRNPAG